jgi:hypothetical protein
MIEKGNKIGLVVNYNQLKFIPKWAGFSVEDER